MASCQAICVDPGRVHQIWPSVCHLIRHAMARGGVSEYGDVERNVRDGSALLWLAWDGTRIHAAAVTELRSANGRKFCTIVACGGEQRRHWLHLLADLESFARAEGCATVLILGRPGWRRVLPDYRVKNIILEKELS